MIRPRPAPWARWPLGLLLGLLAAACSDEPDEPRPVPPPPDADEEFLGLEIRPGSSWFELLDTALVEEYPETNLPPELAELSRAEVLPMRSAELSGWSLVGAPAQKWAHKVPEREGRQHVYWQLRPPVALATEKVEGFSRPRVVLELFEDGEPLPLWDHRGEEPFPDGDRAIFFRQHDHFIGAVCPDPPRGLSIGYQAQSADQFSAYELRHPVGQGPEARPGLEPSSPALRRIETLAQVSRDCLLLPAPGRITLDIDRLHADELCLAVGVVDQGYVVENGRACARSQVSDGVRFLVEAHCEGESAIVWEHRVDSDGVGGAFVEARVDLRDYFGKALSLSLRSDPGPDGNASFDYALWSDLRFRGEAVAEPTRPHIIVLDLDTLRADRMSCYGYDRLTTRRIDGWAARNAVVYENTSATATWTLPSTASIMTGLTLTQHGVVNFAGSLGPETPTLARQLQDAGYETYGIAEGGYVRTRYGFADGFEVYDNTRQRNPDWDQALEWLDGRRSERPFFLFLHTYYTHAPYWWNDRYVDPGYDGPLKGRDVDYENVINPYKRRELELSAADLGVINALYDALIHDLDERVGNFLQRLETRLADQDYVILITSDHGEEFAEHGGMNHGQSLFQELLHVPLIVRYPPVDGEPVADRVSEPTSTLDIVPTLLDLAGLEVPEQLYGRRLHRDELEPGFARPAEHSQGAKSWHVGGYKYIAGVIPNPNRDLSEELSNSPPHQLFNLDEDPAEQQDLFDVESPIAKKLMHDLRVWLKQYPRIERSFRTQGALSPAEKKMLEDLGYTGEDGAEEGSSSEGSPPPEKEGD